MINWPHYIMQDMMKCRDNNMPLLYAILITRIMQVYGLDLSNDVAIMLRWNYYFGKNSMTKLNIFQINGVWQLGRPDQADKEDDEDLQLAQEDVQGSQPEPEIPNQTDLLTQIWVGMQNMQESMRNINTHIDRVYQRMKRIEDTLNDIQHHQGH